MTRIDFYVLEEPGTEPRRRLACRLAEKAFAQGHAVFLHAADEAEAAALDELLWTFRAGSFVPHARPGDPLAATVRVLIDAGAPPADMSDVLVNLHPDVPPFFSRFGRLAEIVTPDTRAAARARYRHYQQRGYPLHTHRLGR
ncbi:DNA polymerase III subunit chi [Inmirania thermothiophila]|uniref:DNA polymerase III subunit chi n=1 Tax=Inmirania thermothiophila TaxID=1750597 RepID=UPI000F48EFA9|nr:DNA polymerase III subunit chi [Inmirania thermothiophila]